MLLNDRVTADDAINILNLRLGAEDARWLERYVTALRDQHGDVVSRVLVYGSKARGDAGPDSDLDVIVFVRRGDWRFKFRLVDLAGDLDEGFVVLPSVQIYTERQWASRRRSGSVFAEAVERDGVAVA